MKSEEETFNIIIEAIWDIGDMSATIDEYPNTGPICVLMGASLTNK